MNPAAREPIDAGRCPICGGPNDCQMCTTAAYKGPCWCTKVEIPVELLALVPREFRSKACICPDCVEEFHKQTRLVALSKSVPAPLPERNPLTPCGGEGGKKTSLLSLTVLPGDFYFENGRMVFTAEYLMRRGYCCGNGCRHCPYPQPEPLRVRA